MNIYEIDQAIEGLVDTETGEIMDFDVFAELQMAREQKIENMALWVKNLLADADAIKAEKNALAERETSARNKANSLKDYLGYILGGEKYATPKVAITWRKSSSVEVGEEFMPWAIEHAPDFLRVRDPEPDKTAIKEALKMGTAIPGATVIEKQSIQIK